LIVLDTHVWLWSVDAPQRLSTPARRAIERADRIGVPTMSVMELAGLVQRGRLELDVPVRAWVRDALARDRVEPLQLTTEVALDAAQLSFEGDPADRIIYATARAADAQLVTRDARLRAFDPELTLW
jgi:PIN domain nuclease of toxin-antitoxin system